MSEALERATDAIWRCNEVDRDTAEIYARLALKAAGVSSEPKLNFEKPTEGMWLGLRSRVRHDRIAAVNGPLADFDAYQLQRAWPAIIDALRLNHRCVICDGNPIIELDGDNLCKEHADAWCRAEGQSVQEQEDPS